SYEVGPEFPAPFLEHDRSAKDLFAPAARPGHHLFDLKGYVLRRLVGAGVGETETLPSDTYGEPQMFYSYRRSCHRGESDYGRLLSAISLDSSIVRD
ncbi:MAG: laccase domain-containing protein, partial [Kiloniellales bacterium]|nr:laccase domain-containing protein [Kiloniellales bacterium]